MTGEIFIPPQENGEERRVTHYLLLSDFIKNIQEAHNRNGIIEPADIFTAMSGDEAIMYKVDAKQPENMAIMIDAMLDTDEVLNKKLKWLYLKMHQTQANFVRGIDNPRLSQVYLDLADRFAEFTDQTHIHGPVFVNDDGPNVRWNGQTIYMSLEAESTQSVVEEPTEISVVMNTPVENAIAYLETGDPAIAHEGLIQGLAWESSMQVWTMDR